MSERTRTFEWSDPLATARGAAGKTGRAFLEAIISGELPPAPVQHTLGFRLTATGDGMARFEGEFAEYHYNPMNSVHGGIACLLLDSAMGASVMSALDEKTGYVTMDLNVHLVRPMNVKTGAFIAEGHVIHRGSRMMTTEAKLTDSQGKLLAHATSTCMLLER